MVEALKSKDGQHIEGWNLIGTCDIGNIQYNMYRNAEGGHMAVYGDIVARGETWSDARDTLLTSVANKKNKTSEWLLDLPAAWWHTHGFKMASHDIKMNLWAYRWYPREGSGYFIELSVLKKGTEFKLWSMALNGVIMADADIPTCAGELFALKLWLRFQDKKHEQKNSHKTLDLSE